MPTDPCPSHPSQLTVDNCFPRLATFRRPYTHDTTKLNCCRYDILSKSNLTHSTLTIAQQSYSQYTDPYHDIPRLDLYQFNGAVMNPMYLVYSPPTMLPTTTLNPTVSATSGASSTSTSSSKLKRGLDFGGSAREVPTNWKVSRKAGMDAMNPDHWWWVGLTMTGVGGLLYFGPRRMGFNG